MSGIGRIYKQPGSQNWTIDYYDALGKRHRESAGTPKRKEAESILKEKIGQVSAGMNMGGHRVTVGEILSLVEADYEVEQHRSADRLEHASAHLREFFGEERQAIAVRHSDVLRYVKYRRAEDAADATIRLELAALKRAYKLAATVEKSISVDQIPSFPKLKIDNVRKGFFTAGEVEAVVAELEGALQPVVRFAFLTGWRRGEILSLGWSQVDWAAEELRLEPAQAKNKSGRTFPFGSYPQLGELLEGRREATKAVQHERGVIVQRVFHRNGRPIKSLRGAWDAACERAGLPGRWFHDLRRSAVRNMVLAGVPRSTATKLSGHRTESVFVRYVIQDKEMLDDGVGKLGRFHEATSAAPREKAERPAKIG